VFGDFLLLGTLEKAPLSLNALPIKKTALHVGWKRGDWVPVKLWQTSTKLVKSVTLGSSEVDEVGNKKKCLNCGSEFEPTCHKTKQKFCCDACRFRYNNAKRYIKVPPGDVLPDDIPLCDISPDDVVQDDSSEKTTLIYCKYCGGEYALSYPPTEYCSELCRRAWWAEQQAAMEEAYKIPNPRKNRPTGVCPQCGVKIVQRPKIKRRIFCSTSCRHKWWTAHRWLSKQKECAFTTCTCRHCGRIFDSYGNARRKYCDKDCQRAACGRGPKEPMSVGRLMIPKRAVNEEDWKQRLRIISETSQEKPNRRIVLVCGTTKLRVENLSAIIRYRLEEDPYGGDLYVFCDNSRKHIGLLQWDGDTFRLGTRKL